MFLTRCSIWCCYANEFPHCTPHLFNFAYIGERYAHWNRKSNSRPHKYKNHADLCKDNEREGEQGHGTSFTEISWIRKTTNSDNLGLSWTTKRMNKFLRFYPSFLWYKIQVRIATKALPLYQSNFINILVFKLLGGCKWFLQ